MLFGHQSQRSGFNPITEIIRNLFRFHMGGGTTSAMPKPSPKSCKSGIASVRRIPELETACFTEENALSAR